MEDLPTFVADITELMVGGVLVDSGPLRPAGFRPGAPSFVANPKPHPDVYLTVRGDLGVTQDRYPAIEDSWTGVQVDSAKAGVDGLLASDAECWSSARPDMVLVAELDADVVQKFSEA